MLIHYIIIRAGHTYQSIYFKKISQGASAQNYQLYYTEDKTWK